MGITQQIGASSLIKPGVIDNTAARPASPYEGQVIYQKDTDQMFLWNGTSWKQIITAATAGAVLQVANATTSTLTTATIVAWVDSTLSVTITPQYSTSKIFVMVNQSLYVDTANNEGNYRLLRGATVLQTQKAPAFSPAGAIVGQGVFMFLDSPGTTSATTYKTQIAIATGAGTIYANINNNPANITVFEISA